MKLKSHFLIFTILFVINLFFVGFVVFDDSSSPSRVKRIVPDKVKFKYTDNKDEALVIKTNKASGTTKLEINMNNKDGVPVKIELKAKVDPKNPAKLKYKYRDEDDDKSTFVAIKYPGVKKAQTNGSDSANVATNEQVNNQDKDSFKIFLERNGAEALVCKVKFGDGKLKIGSDEEIATPTYEIKNTLERKKKSYVEKLKVYHKGKYIAAVSRSKESGKYKVKLVKEGQEEKEDLFSTKDLNYMSYAVGIMGIESMDPKLRAVIAAEILKKEK
jgi:hypothetical protein